nr:hypothetical protein GCM10020093_014310 [Planobispora longispora]
MAKTIMRRDFLKAAAAGTGLAAVGLPPPPRRRPRPRCSGTASPPATRCRTPSSSGRGSPSPEAVPGSGAGAPAEVTWQVAADPEFQRIVASGTLTTGPERDHTVKADVRGLEAATAYHYRFLYAGVASPAGLTRTAPRPEDDVDGLRLGVVSCSNWEAATSPPTVTWRPAATCSASSIWATTSTSTAGGSSPRAAPWCDRTSPRTRSSPWRTTGRGTASTRPTPTCRPCTRPAPG